MTPESIDNATQLARLWDEIVLHHKPQIDADANLLSEIVWLEELARVPPPPPALAAQTWQVIAGTPLPLGVYQPALPPALNGHHPSRTFSESRQRSRRSSLVAAGYRQLAVGTMAGLVGGFLAGVWARIAMRIAGFLTIDQNHRLLTENDAAVGRITFDGTMFLGMLGAAAGVGVGILYFAIRRWLPGSGWKRWLTFGGLLLAIFGFVVMDTSNPDYHLFGPPWLNVSAFSFAYIVMGFCVGMLADRLDRSIPSLIDPEKTKRLRIVTAAAMAPFALIGLIALAGFLLGTRGLGAIAIGVLLISALPLYRPDWARRFPRTFQQPQRFAYAVLALPSLIGVVVTLRAIVIIVGG